MNISGLGPLALAVLYAVIFGLCVLLLTGCAPLGPVRKAVAENPRQDCAKRHGRLMARPDGWAVCVTDDED